MVSNLRTAAMAPVVGLVACLALAVPAQAGAPSGFPYHDANNNGVFDAGDTDISGDLKANGYFTTTESIVVPASMKSFVTKGGAGLTLVAGKNLTVEADVLAVGAGAGVTLVAETGPLTIGGGVTIRATDYVSLSGGQGLVLGVRSGVMATSRNGSVSMYAEAGDLVLMDYTRVQAGDFVDIGATQGNVTMGANVQIFSSNGPVGIMAGGDVNAAGVRVQADSLNVSSGGHLVDLSGGRVMASRDGFVLIQVAGSTIDVTGTVFKNVDDSSLYLLAPEVLR
jgi:hypothetical protein